MSLARSAIRGVGATIAGQWGRLAIQIGATMVLARLLTPEDYGLVGMVLAVTGLAERLKMMGLSTVTVQRREIDQDQLSFLFWVNVGLGVGFAVVLGALAPLVSRFYGAPELTGITVALTVSFVLGGIAAQHVALLTRRLEFGSLAIIEVLAILFGSVAAIVAAGLGAGYWALVVFHVTQPGVRALIAWRRTRWRPKRPAWAREGWQMLSFGANLGGFELLNYFARHMDNVLIGRYLGAEPLGAYTKAYGLLLLPVQQIQGPVHRVAVPTLSRLQDDPERFRRFFLTGLRSVAFVVIPLITALAVLAEEVILILLGDQWTDAISVFQILAFVGMVHALGHSNGWLYIALGNVRRQLGWSLVEAPLVVLSFVLGLRFGIEGVATAYAVTMWLLLLPSFWNATRGTPVSIPDVIACGLRPAIVSLVGFVSVVALRSALPPVPVPVSGVILGIAYLTAVGAAIGVWPSARGDAQAMVTLLRTGFRGAA